MIIEHDYQISIMAKPSSEIGVIDNIIIMFLSYVDPIFHYGRGLPGRAGGLNANIRAHHRKTPEGSIGADTPLRLHLPIDRYQALVYFQLARSTFHARYIGQALRPGNF